MDGLIAKVDSQRANLGAMQNRLESSIRNQSNVAANELTHAHVFVMLTLQKSLQTCHNSSIIQQAAASMLMQANTRP